MKNINDLTPGILLLFLSFPRTFEEIHKQQENREQFLLILIPRTELIWEVA